MCLLPGVLSASAADTGPPSPGQIVPAPTPCDPQYYDSLESRAWLEAQRELTQNQNLIFKPDSVLQYTCFEQFLSILGANAATTMFSGTQRWGPANSPTSLGDNLFAIVGMPMVLYVYGNYPPTLLGGRSNVAYAPVPTPIYTCSMMNQVWKAAKCMDFTSDPDNDGFYSFVEYENDPDKRAYPIACPGPGARWQTERENAVVNQTTTWYEDDVRTYLPQMDPANCGSTVQPIATGIMVTKRKSGEVFPEMVCAAPGCHYNGSQCTN